MMNFIIKIRKKGFRGTLKATKLRLEMKIILPYQVAIKYNNVRNSIEKSYLDIHEIRQKTLWFVENMRIKNGDVYGMYKYSPSQKEPTLYSSCYAALVRDLYKDLENLSTKERKEWITYIQSFQCEDGLFRDPKINNEIAGDSDWWGWRHLTLHCIMALTALGAKPILKFKIIEPFKNTNFVIKWLESQDWTIDPATTSNKIQNYFTLLQYTRDFQGEDWANKSLSVAYEWLDQKQDHKTGLWGKRFTKPQDLSNGVQTGYHIWLLYFYDKRDIRYKNQIIDSCLATQNKLGGFGVPLNSSACEDIDSIDPLIRLSLITTYRKDAIEKALQKAIPWIFVNMNEDGGFVFRRFESFTYGHQLMSSKKDESAMFPTWFRTLSLAYLGKYFPDSFLGKFNWKFLNSPGLQFWNS